MTRMRLILTLAGVLSITAAAPAGAQGRGRGVDTIPTAYKPPAGMCRIWLDDVPPARQPAPTECASAVRNRPSNGRVIFGDEPKDKSRFRDAKPGRGDREEAWDRRRANDEREKGEKKKKPDERDN